MTYEEFLLIFMGGVGMMTLYMGAQAIVTGERAYRYYTAYAFCWIIYFFFKVIWTFSDARIESIIYPFNRIGFPMLAYIFYYRFADAFLDLRRLLPRIFWLFRWMEYVLLTYVTIEVVICVFFNDWANSVAHELVHVVIRLGVAVVSVYGILNAWDRRNQLVYYFVTGSALLLVFGLTSMALSFTRFADGDDYHLIGPLFFLNIGVLLELLCFSLGLSYKNKQTEIQKITIEQEVLREREQRELAQLKTQFFTNISHEFRTPLTLILGPLTDLLQKNPAYPTYQLMHRNASRLLALVNQLLDLSKLDAGQLQPDVKLGNLTEWLRLLTGSFSSLAESRSIQLSFSTETSLFDSAYFDQDKVEKIVTNLVANALKFTPTNGVVLVQLAASTNSQAVIQIRDTGVGIPVDQQARIFERFHQVVSNSSTNVEGTGIGLALVRELVSVLKGAVSVESQVGQGTTFTITLPVDAETWATEVNKSTIVDFQDTNRNSNETEVTAQDRLLDVAVDIPNLNRAELPLLLIIDDNADVRQYIRQIMTPTYRIIEAVDGKDGLYQATEVIPDIVICDWMMPIMNGMVFCQTLKTQPTTDHIPVIMLTAKATTENRIEGFSGGADDYLAKPFNPAELRIRVENLLTQRQKLRERFSRELYLKPTNVQVSSAEEVFLQNAIRIIESHLSESSFSAEQFADELNLSRMQLHRKLKSLTNQSATEFVRHVRLQRAADLLVARSATVSEVAFTVGFESLSYFSKSFKEQFGVLPSDYEPITQLASPTD